MRPFNLNRLPSYFLCLVAAHAQDTTGAGSVTGTVSESPAKLLAGARICLVEVEKCAAADGRGVYRIEGVRAGSYTIEVTPPGRAPVRQGGVEIRAGLEARVDLTLPALETQRQEVTVTESVFLPPEEVKNSGYLIQRREISKSAGALQDVSRYVQTLPGVAIGSNDFRNDIIVRGGSPLENLFIVDNIEIPNINAFANFAAAGGTVSLLDAELISDVNFLTGGYPAPYINRVSSVLQIAQREGSREAFQGRATLGFAGGGLILEGPLTRKGSWITSVRRSFLDVFTDDIGFGGVPVLYTYNTKALYDLTPRDRIWMVNISGNDRIRLGASEKTAEENEEINNLDIRYQGWRSATGFNWQRLLGSRAVGLLGVTHSVASVDSTVRDLVRTGVPASNTPIADLIARSPAIFSQDDGERETTIKYDITASSVPVFDKLQTGASYKIFGLRYNTASPFGSSIPFSRVPDVNPFRLRESFSAYQTGAYVQSSRNLTSRLNVTWGGRFDNYEYVSRNRFSPRAGISYRLSDKLSWRASYGKYFQQPFFLFMAAYPQNRALIPIQSTHYVTGFTYLASDTLRFTVEAYAKDYRDYPAATQFPQLSLANVGDTFATRDILFPMTGAGRGRVRGIEFFVEKKFTDKWFGQANLAFSRTRHAGIDGIFRPGAFDYPRIANVVGGYRLSPKWEFSGRVAYLAGRPYTPFDAAESTRQRRAIFDLSRVNAERAPDYVRVDIRADRTFTVRGKPLLVFIGVQNMFNRKNFAQFTWNRRLNEQQVGEQLGLFPLVGLDWRF